jgi:hypothetical protein
METSKLTSFPWQNPDAPWQDSCLVDNVEALLKNRPFLAQEI